MRSLRSRPALADGEVTPPLLTHGGGAALQTPFRSSCFIRALFET